MADLSEVKSRAIDLRDLRKQIDARMKELRPAVEETQQLETALAALEGGSQPRRRRNGRNARNGRSTRPGASLLKPTTGRRSKRGDQVMKLLGKEGELRTSDIAKKIGVAPSQATGILKRLEKQGQVQKTGREWQPA